MKNYMALSGLLSSLEASLRDHKTPAPDYSFAEWLKVRSELREVLADLRSAEEQRDIFFKGCVRAMPSFADTSDD